MLQFLVGFSCACETSLSHSNGASVLFLCHPFQVHGGAGVSEDFILAKFLAALRTLRIADGPDAVHKRSVALLEVKKAKKQFQESSQRSSL